MQVKLSMRQCKRDSLIFLTLFWIVIWRQIYLSFFLLKTVYCNHVLDKKKHEDGNK